MEFLTIQEAVNFTGKAEITIRRVVKKLMMTNHDQAKNDNIRMVKGGKGQHYTIKKAYLITLFNMTSHEQSCEEMMTNHDQANLIANTVDNTQKTQEIKENNNILPVINDDEQSYEMMTSHNDKSANNLLLDTINTYKSQIQKQQEFIQNQEFIINNLIKQKSDSETLFTNSLNKLIESESETKKLVQNQQIIQKELQNKIDLVLELASPLLKIQADENNQTSNNSTPASTKVRKKLFGIF